MWLYSQVACTWTLETVTIIEQAEAVYSGGSSSRDAIFSNTIRRGRDQAYLRNGWVRIELYGGLGDLQIPAKGVYRETDLITCTIIRIRPCITVPGVGITIVCHVYIHMYMWPSSPPSPGYRVSMKVRIKGPT